MAATRHQLTDAEQAAEAPEKWRQQCEDLQTQLAATEDIAVAAHQGLAKITEEFEEVKGKLIAQEEEAQQRLKVAYESNSRIQEELNEAKRQLASAMLKV